MTVRRILVGHLITNCYLLIFSDRVVVVDPGDSPEKILKFCGELPITDILLTHGHMDHIAAMADLYEKFAPRIRMHIDDVPFLNDNALRAPFDAKDWWRTDYTYTDPVEDGQEISLGSGDEEVSFRVIHTPGHTPGSICFYQEKDRILFSGDTLFKGTQGRTDFPGGDQGKMLESLKKLSYLPADTVVYPGHGFGTKIGDEGWIAGDSI